MVSAHRHLPQIQEDEPSSFIKFDKFEKKVVELMQSGEYLPDTEDVLKQALRVCSRGDGNFLPLLIRRGIRCCPQVIAKSLDPDGESKEKDTIEADALCDLLRRRGTPFREKEVESKAQRPTRDLLVCTSYLSTIAATDFTKGAEPEDGVIHIEDYLSNFADVVNKPI